MNNPTEELIRQLDGFRRSNSEQLELFNRVVAQRDMLYEALKSILEHVENETTQRKDNQCTLCHTYRMIGWDALTKVGDRNE